ncbi:hypothetical protein [Sorangium sp. So ce341]|uniref:hypothetical protein n=1 Tax=Sorangium sp. So ce341 TaxID=3133302 RepID=UPI003F619ACC
MATRTLKLSFIAFALATTGICACGSGTPAPATTETPPRDRQRVPAGQKDGKFMSSLCPADSTVEQYIPFRVKPLVDVTSGFPRDMPALQSFAFARYPKQKTRYWIFIAGRTNGFHGFQPDGDEDFPTAKANQKIWVVENVYAARKNVYSMQVSQLPDKVGNADLRTLKSQWQSSNPLYFQDDNDWLWIAGGYGADSGGNYQTFPTLSVVKIADLVNAVKAGDPNGLAAAIAVTPGPTAVAQSTGGEMLKLPDDGKFYVVMGHNFQGKYSTFVNNNQQNGNGASQTYLNAINQFNADANFANNLVTVTGTTTFTPDNSITTISSPSLPNRYLNLLEFARRDLNVAYTVMDNEKAGIGVYGGVFTPNPMQLNYTFPIYLGPNAQQATIDNSYEQKMSAYSCAKVVFYSRFQKFTYTTLFGGMSRWRFDGSIKEFVENARIGSPQRSVFSDGMPWSNNITTLVHSWTPPEHTLPTCEIPQETNLPGYLGSEALFIPDSSETTQLQVAISGTDVLDFDNFPLTEFRLGHLYGGIAGYPTDSYQGVQVGSGQTKNSISKNIYEVRIQLNSPRQ